MGWEENGGIHAFAHSDAGVVVRSCGRDSAVAQNDPGVVVRERGR